MPLRPEDLPRRLREQLAPVYLVSGDETLLVEEACDAILGAATQAGFSEREVHFAESGFHWETLVDSAASLSLFATRKVIDVRVKGSKFDKAATDILHALCQQPTDDVLLLVRCGLLDKRARSSAWFKAFEQSGEAVVVWGIGAKDWPRWCAARLQAAGVVLTPEALQLFQHRLEGNLLAAVQEINKLRMSGLEAPIDAETLAGQLEDLGQFDAFELIDAVFSGDASRAVRVLHLLAESGVSNFAIQGALAAQVRALEKGGWMPRDREAAARAFHRRVKNLPAVLAEIALLDQQGKGQLLGESWQSLENLLLRLCGVRQQPLLSEQRDMLRPNY